MKSVIFKIGDRCYPEYLETFPTEEEKIDLFGNEYVY